MKDFPGILKDFKGFESFTTFQSINSSFQNSQFVETDPPFMSAGGERLIDGGFLSFPTDWMRERMNKAESNSLASLSSSSISPTDHSPRLSVSDEHEPRLDDDRALTNSCR